MQNALEIRNQSTKINAQNIFFYRNNYLNFINNLTKFKHLNLFTVLTKSDKKMTKNL